mgnify:CR=1 FL=1
MTSVGREYIVVVLAISTLLFCVPGFPLQTAWPHRLHQLLRLPLTHTSGQEALAAREAEVARLSAATAAGPTDVDALAARCRTEANEALILQLSQQVGAGGEARGRRKWRGVWMQPGRQAGAGARHLQVAL